MRKAVSISNGALWCIHKRTWCSHEGTNRTWDEGSLCRVVPCRACSTPRGTNARCAEYGSGQRLAHFKVVRTSVVLNVVPVNAFATLRDMNARCASVILSAWFRQAQLLVSFQRSRHMPQLGCLSKLSPNTRLQRTPLRVERDRAFFSASFCYNVLAINRWRRR